MELTEDERAALAQLIAEGHITWSASEVTLSDELMADLMTLLIQLQPAEQA